LSVSDLALAPRPLDRFFLFSIKLWIIFFMFDKADFYFKLWSNSDCQPY
jgi:hypothetical protein